MPWLEAVRLPVAEADTGEFIAAAMTALGIMFKPAYRYKKAGVTFLDLAPVGCVTAACSINPTKHGRSGARV
jgi:DNA polymerase V